MNKQVEPSKRFNEFMSEWMNEQIMFQWMQEWNDDMADGITFRNQQRKIEIDRQTKREGERVWTRKKARMNQNKNVKATF